MSERNLDGLAIRREQPRDRAAVSRINTQAFETSCEAKLVDALRGVAKPLISLVAVLDRRLVGHILFTPVTVDIAPTDVITLGLGPMAVLCEHQNQGVGSRLVRAGLDECHALPADAVFVLGHAEYYPRFGFQPAATFGLRYKNEQFDPYFMVIELHPGALRSMSGDVHYHPAFEWV